MERDRLCHLHFLEQPPKSTGHGRTATHTRHTQHYWEMSALSACSCCLRARPDEASQCSCINTALFIKDDKVCEYHMHLGPLRQLASKYAHAQLAGTSLAASHSVADERMLPAKCSSHGTARPSTAGAAWHCWASSSVLCAILWYQGCSRDAVSVQGFRVCIDSQPPWSAMLRSTTTSVAASSRFEGETVHPKSSCPQIPSCRCLQRAHMATTILLLRT
jgi:hypothetical protein